MSKPNILMVMADQLPAAAVGAYGHPVVKTPNVDRLAAEGVLFENCCCNSPLCVPSRASMVTGRLPCRIGSFDNGSELPAQIPTFMHHLRRAGYQTIASGKLHFIGPDQLHGFEERLTTDIYPSSFSWTPDWREGVVGNQGSSAAELKNAGLCRWNMQMDYDEEVHFRALEKLRALAGDNGRRPFFFCVSYTHPHQPFITTQEYWDLYDHDAIDMPAAPAVPLEKMHPYNQWLQVHHCVDQYPPSDETIRNARHAFYGMISYWDEKVGELLDELARQGLAENTVVLALSDHGEMMGEHGMWFKRTFYDWSVRVPLVCSWKGKWRGGRRVGETVSLVDLFPTLLDIAELPDREDVAEGIDGHSLLPFLADGSAEWNHAAVCEYCGEGVLRPMRALCRDRYKYVHVEGEKPLLFDLASDPRELTNLHGRVGLATWEAKLREEVLAGWDAGGLEQQVRASQRSRLLINEAMALGRPVSWDYQPPSDASKQYVR